MFDIVILGHLKFRTARQT